MVAVDDLQHDEILRYATVMGTILLVVFIRTVSCALRFLLKRWRVDLYQSNQATVLLRSSQDENRSMISCMRSGAGTLVMCTVESFFTCESSLGTLLLMSAGLCGHASLG